MPRITLSSAEEVRELLIKCSEHIKDAEADISSLEDRLIKAKELTEYRKAKRKDLEDVLLFLHAKENSDGV